MIVVALVITPASYFLGRSHSQVAEAHFDRYLDSDDDAAGFQQYRHENAIARRWGWVMLGALPGSFAVWALGSWVMFGSLRATPKSQ